MTFEDIIGIIESSFGFEPESRIIDNVLYLRVGGIDNVSLAKYILEKTNNFKITVKEREGYKFSDMEWIKIEQNEISELVYSGNRNICFH